MFFTPCFALLALMTSQDPAVTKPKANPFEAMLKVTSYAYKVDKDGEVSSRVNSYFSYNYFRKMLFMGENLN